MNFMLVDGHVRAEVGDWVRIKTEDRHRYVAKRTTGSDENKADFIDLDLRVIGEDPAFYTLAIVFGDQNGLQVDRDHVEKIPPKDRGW